MELVEFCVLISLMTLKLCKKFVIQKLYHLEAYIPMYVLIYIRTHFTDKYGASKISIHTSDANNLH